MENISIQDGEGQIFCRISSYKDILHIHWLGTSSETMIKQACNEVVRAVDHARCQKLICNQQQIQCCVGMENWMRSIWIPNLQYMGLQYFAQVHAPEVFDQRTVQQNQESTIHSIIIQHFCEEEDAKQWFNMLEHVLVD